jgi:hypothetical protein
VAEEILISEQGGVTLLKSFNNEPLDETTRGFKQSSLPVKGCCHTLLEILLNKMCGNHLQLQSREDLK